MGVNRGMEGIPLRLLWILEHQRCCWKELLCFVLMFTIDVNVYLLRGLHDGDWVGLLVCADRGRVQAQDTHPALSHQQHKRTSTNAQAHRHKHKHKYKYANTHPPRPISPTALPLSKFRLVPHAQHHFGLCKSIQTSSAPIMTKFENLVLSQ